MRQLTSAMLLILLAALPMTACSDNAGDTDSGGVELVVSDFDGRPIRVSVNQAGGAVLIEEITLESIVENPDLGTGNLQTIELSSYEVTYTRADSGTRVPIPLVRKTFGTIPPGGNTTIENFPVMLAPQMTEPPISDLLFENGAIDRETGESIIVLNLAIRFFGETLGGRNVVSRPQVFTVEFIP